MNLIDCSKMVNRAMSHTFEKLRFALLLSVLILCGLITSVFRGFSLIMEELGLLTPTILPFFISTGLLMAVSIPLIRMYHYQVTKQEYNFKKVMANSKKSMLFACLVCVPLTIAYLLTWFSLGMFMFLKELPIWGTIFGVLFSFFPFALVLSSSLFLVLCFGCCFFCAPAIAIKNISKFQSLIKDCLMRLTKDFFTNFLLFVLTLIPVVLLVILMLFSSMVTEMLYYLDQTSIEGFLTSFFLILPAMLLLTPVFSFMFNFSYEAYVKMHYQSELAEELSSDCLKE